MRTIISLVVICFLQSMVAQNTVTFQVNMNEYSGSYTTVNLNGVFNGWCGGCAEMTDDNSDGIYTIDVDLANGPIEYKFTVDGWEDQENFVPGGPCTLTSGEFTNRFYEVDGNATLAPACWGACEDCGGAPSSANITFSVDMSEFTGAFTTVNLNGTFNDWCGTCAVMTDDDVDGIYEITVNIAIGNIDYKFTIDGWEGEEILTEGLPCTMTTDGFTNRFHTVDEETTLPTVCWESCASCTPDGIDEFTTLDMVIQPNPSNGDIQITLAPEFLNEIGQVNIFTLAGEKVSSRSISSISNGRLDLSELSGGMYLIEVRSDEFQSLERLMIQK